MTLAYEKPGTLPEALALRTLHAGKFPVLAGGTDLIVQWRAGAISPPGFIDISGLAELRAITADKHVIEIGACVTHTAIAAHEAVRHHLPALAEACRTIGAVQIQNQGTIGGNVMNASPAGDTLPAFFAYEAEFLAQDLKGERWIPAKDFFTAYRQTALAPHELLTRVRMKIPKAGEIARFEKIGMRRAQAISKVSLCARARIVHGGIEWIHIALGSVAATPVRAPGTEALLRGKVITENLIERARASLSDEIHPIDDVRSTADYRRFAAGSLLVRFLREALAQGRAAQQRQHH